jgi:hypothetical protein
MLWWMKYSEVQIPVAAGNEGGIRPAGLTSKK